jgi:hypothetical protein
MAEDESKIGESIEHAGEDETEKMDAGVDAEAPSPQRELLVALEIRSHDRGMGFAWVEVNRHSECLRTLEYAPELLVVEKAALRVAIDHRTLESKFGDRAIELLDRGSGIRSRKGCKPVEAIGMRVDRLEKHVVDLPRRRDSRSGIECLTTRLIV